MAEWHDGVGVSWRYVWRRLLINLTTLYMDIKVLTIPSESKSAQKLGFPMETYDFLSMGSHQDKVIVRWGNSNLTHNRASNKLEEYPFVLNKSESIVLNCSKQKALEKIATVVTTPKIFQKRVPRKKRAVYRNIFHSAGKDFAVIRGPKKIEENKYATEYIGTKYEFRVFFCGNSVMLCRRVTRNKNKIKEKYPCRSLWPYSFYKKVPKQLKAQVLAAAKTVGLDFGAADILFKNKKYYFLELNTAPSLDDKKIIAFYKRNLKNMIMRRFKKAFEKRKKDGITFVGI